MAGDAIASRWTLFKSWMHFSLLLTTGLVVANAVVKLLERSAAQEMHWLYGTASLSSFIIIRLLLIISVSLTVSILTTLAGVPSPYGHRIRNATDQQLVGQSDERADWQGQFDKRGEIPPG